MKTNVKKHILSVIIASIMSPVAMAGAYQFEVGAAGIEADYDNIDANSRLIGGSFYLKPIESHQAPLAEAGYFAKAGYLSFSALNTTNDFDDYEADTRDFSLYVVTEANHIILGIGKTSEKRGIDNMETSSGIIDVSEDRDSAYVVVGAYLSNTSSLQLQFDRGDGEYEEKHYLSSPQDSGYYQYNNSYEITEVTAEYKNIVQLNNGSHLSFDLELNRKNIANAEIEKGIEFDTTLYPTRQLGIGFSLGATNSDASDNTRTYGINIEHFVTENIAIFTLLEREKMDNVDADTLAFGIYARL